MLSAQNRNTVFFKWALTFLEQSCFHKAFAYISISLDEIVCVFCEKRKISNIAKQLHVLNRRLKLRSEIFFFILQQIAVGWIREIQKFVKHKIQIKIQMNFTKYRSWLFELGIHVYTYINSQQKKNFLKGFHFKKYIYFQKRFYWYMYLMKRILIKTAVWVIPVHIYCLVIVWLI